MSSASYASRQFSDSVDISSSLSEAIIALEMVESDEAHGFSDKELEKMIDQGREVLEMLIQFVENDYKGDNTVASKIIFGLSSDEVGYDKAKRELERGKEALEDENWSDAEEVLENIQSISEEVSEDRYSKVVLS